MVGPVQQSALRRHGPWAGAGVAICASFLMVHEGYAPVATHERVDPPRVITWCFGRTNYDYPGVKAGTRFNKAQCEQFLSQDLPKYAAPVQECIPTFDTMPPTRQASLVSFSYNLGSGTLCKSKVAHQLNAGNISGGCNAMAAYVRANGKVLQGLVNRRRDEIKLCLKDGAK